MTSTPGAGLLFEADAGRTRFVLPSHARMTASSDIEPVPLPQIRFEEALEVGFAHARFAG